MIQRICAVILSLYLVFIISCSDPNSDETNGDKNNQTSDSNPPATVNFFNASSFRVDIYKNLNPDYFDPTTLVCSVNPVSTQKITLYASTDQVIGDTFYFRYKLLLANSLETGTTDIYVDAQRNLSSISFVVENGKIYNKTIPQPTVGEIKFINGYIAIKNMGSTQIQIVKKNEILYKLYDKGIYINPEQVGYYEITPGSVSEYSILRNASLIALPTELSEFKAGIIYVFTYNGTVLTLTSQNSTLQKIPPETPENVRIEDITVNSVKITWDNVYGATSYLIYRATDSATSTYSQIANTTALSWTDTGISTGKTYYYKVSAVSGINMISEQSATVAAIMPPANVRVSDETTISLILRWNAVSGASGYNVYRSNNEGETYSKVNSAAINGISFTDTGLSPGIRYYYKVSVIINGVEGVQSAPVSTVTLSSIPTNLRITAATNTSVNIVWNAVKEASGYYIYRSINENGTYTKINSSATSGTAFTDTSVSAYTIYYYKVSAIVGGIESGMSSFVSASTGIIVPGNGLAAKLAWLKSNVASNQFYLIEITTDENIVPQTLYYSNKSDITITLSGGGSMRTVNLSAQGSLFTINSGVTLILNNNITLNGRSGNNDSLVCIISGTLIMNAGTKIIGNSFAGNDYSSGSGGGVNVYNGIFTMNGGEISGNTAQYGSAVFVKSSDFTMNDGEISGNTASNSGGAVYNDDGYFTMNGGKISGNTAKWGGGIYINDASFNMNGGKITNNTASGNSSSRGGGVCISGGAFQMKDGEIFKNNTTGNGGGVYIGDNSWAGIFKIAGGVIYGNNTTTDLKNTAANGTALYKNSSTAQYGTFNGNNFYRSGDLTTTNTTIRVVNGDLLTE